MKKKTKSEQKKSVRKKTTVSANKKSSSADNDITDTVSVTAVAAPGKAAGRPTLSLGKKIVFTLIPVIIFFLLSEILLGFINPEAILIKADDPETVYRFYPDRKGIIQTEEFRAEVATNALGMRDCHQSKEIRTSDAAENHAGFNKKTLSQGPLLFLGDSFTEGWGVSCSDIFPEIVKGFYPGPVHNGGIHGGSPPVYVLLAREYIKITRPTKLIIQIFDNDLFDSVSFYKYLITDEKKERIISAKPLSLGPLPGGWLTRKIRELNWYRLSKRVYKKISGNPDPVKYYHPHRVPAVTILSQEDSIRKFGKIQSLSDPDKDYGGQFAFYKYKTLTDLKKDPDWAEAVRLFSASLSQLIDESLNHTGVILLYIPAKEVFAPEGIVKGGADGLRNNPMAELLQQIAQRNKVKLIDARDVLKKSPDEYYFPRDAHLNAAGHRVVAELLKKYL